jgi:hypothetical protein
MATAAEISRVRINTSRTSNEEPYTDEYIAVLIDEGTVASATVAIWRSIAAGYAAAVDVSEAGASHKFSDLFKHASAMITEWQAVVDAESGASAALNPRVSSIERTT